MSHFFSDLKRYLPYSFVAAKCQLKAEVAGSYLNWLWWILNPLCFMLLYTFIFGYVFNAREPYFPVFIFVGISMWDFFRATVTQSVSVVKKNKSVISRVYMPKYLLVLELMWVNGFKMMISFCIVFAMMLFFSVPVSLNVFYFIPIIAVLFLVTFGIACYVMHLGVFVSDMSNVINLLMRMLMYFTGIFYNVETRIPYYGALLNRYNPVAFLISSMRKCLMYETVPELKIITAWAAVGIVLTFAGVRMIYREENGYVKVI